MTGKTRFSIVAFAILKFLQTKETPQTYQEISQALKPDYRDRIKYQFSPMSRLGYVKITKNKHDAVAYSILKKGRDLLTKKDALDLVEYVNESEQNLKHPETGEPITKYKLAKYYKEKGIDPPNARPRKKKDEQESAGAALPNVSSNANNLMDNISTVIHENAAYREALLKIGNQIAGLLDMKLVQRNQP